MTYQIETVHKVDNVSDGGVDDNIDLSDEGRS